MIESKKDITVIVTGQDIEMLSHICELARIYIQEKENRPICYPVQQINNTLSQLFDATK